LSDFIKRTSKLKSNYYILSTISLYFLSGLTIAFLSALLIYFKQKEVFHHATILFSVFAIYSLRYPFRKWMLDMPKFFVTVSLILITLICLIGPQFIYQVRPHTFYITGFTFGGILIVATAGTILSPSISIKKPWNYFPFLVGYTVGHLLPPAILQYLIFGLSFIVTVYVLISIELKPILKASISIAIILSFLVFWRISIPIKYYEGQSGFEDKVLFTAETQYHKLVITQWHEDFWFFMDKLKNISSIDEYLYYEPMTHSVFRVANRIEKVLVIGGENGCLIREALKNEDIQRIDVISYDTLLQKLGMENQYYISMNQHAYEHEKVHIIHEDLLRYISKTNERYDAIFIDLPDPRSIETNRYYTIEFYNIILTILNEEGVMITQAGSPYYATQAFYTIGRTIQEAGFNVLPIHNQILTLGEWGWFICSTALDSEVLRKRLVEQKELTFETKWFNREAANLISSFGKTYDDTLNVQINSLDNPLVYKYYLKGNWNLR